MILILGHFVVAGCQLPIEASQRFSLSHAHQQEVCIVVLEAASEPAGQPIPGTVCSCSQPPCVLVWACVLVTLYPLYSVRRGPAMWICTASTALGEGRPVSTKLLTTLDLVGLPPLTPGSSISTGRGRPAVR